MSRKGLWIKTTKRGTQGKSRGNIPEILSYLANAVLDVTEQLAQVTGVSQAEMVELLCEALRKHMKEGREDEWQD